MEDSAPTYQISISISLSSWILTTSVQYSGHLMTVTWAKWQLCGRDYKVLWEEGAHVPEFLIVEQIGWIPPSHEHLAEGHWPILGGFHCTWEQWSIRWQKHPGLAASIMINGRDKDGVSTLWGAFAWWQFFVLTDLSIIFKSLKDLKKHRLVLKISSGDKGGRAIIY